VLAGWSIISALLMVKRPAPKGHRSLGHEKLSDILSTLATRGAAALGELRSPLSAYVDEMTPVDPNDLLPGEALAYWLNLYNALALDLAAQAQARGESSVLRLPGAFSKPIVEVQGEKLSLDGIEHGKVRRFGDPRVHAALVCGSVSCPTLRSTPYSGTDLDQVLDDQMRQFLAKGGLMVDGDSVLLSRVFKWYGADFVWPHRMPVLWPAPKRKVLDVITPWVDADVSAMTVEYQSYDWGLRCSVG